MVCELFGIQVYKYVYKGGAENAVQQILVEF